LKRKDFQEILRLPWAQEVSGSNPDAPTTLFLHLSTEEAADPALTSLKFTSSAVDRTRRSRITFKKFQQFSRSRFFP
jgi:hypothetical protein